MTDATHEDDGADDNGGEQRSEREVAVEVRVEAPPAEVFEYVSDPARFPGVDGPVTLGEIIERSAPRRVRWHAGTRGGNGETADAVVEVTLTPDGAGTKVRVVQRPPSAVVCERIRTPRRHEMRSDAHATPCRAAARLNLMARAR